MRPPDRRDRVPGESVFRALLLLHPPAFRRRWGDEMLRTFREAWRAEARGRGGRAAAGFWLRMLRGTVRVAIEQRLRARTTTTGGWKMGDAMRELGLVVRSLGRRPGFVAVTVATFALGMGANTAVFSVLHGVLLAPLPYEDGERLVRLYVVEDVEPDDLEDVPGMAFIELRERVRSVDLVAMYNYVEESVDLTGGDRPERARLLRVGSGYFELLDTPPMIGRGFLPDEERDSAFVAIVREGVWERYLGGDPDAVGSASIDLGGVSHTVVGVVPETFDDPLDDGVDVWTPQNLQRGGSNNFDNQYLTVLGRLGPDVRLEAARAEVAAVSRRFGELDPAAEGRRAHLVPLREDVAGDTGTLLWVLLGASGLLLLIACVNVASLFLVRGASLRGELAIRAALGSGRGRLVRKLLTESVVLSLAGGAAGLLLGGLMLGTLLAAAPPDLPRIGELGMGTPILLYGAGLSLVAGVLFGLAPALRYSRPGTEGVLAGEASGRSVAPRRHRLHDALVVGEIALALVLLVGAGVLARSLHELRTVDLGFDAAGVQTFEVHVPDGRYGDPAERARFHRALHERVEAIPGVVRAGAISDLPATGEWFRWGTGLSAASGERDLDTFIGANQRAVEGDYFEAMGIPLLRGRTFGTGDDVDAPHVVVVNETLVRRLWPGRDLGDVPGGELWYGPWRAQVIGVVGDAAVGPRGEVAPKVYHGHRQFAENRNWSMVQVLRTDVGIPGLAEVLRREVAALDPLLVVAEVRPLAGIVGRGVARERFAALLLVTFSAVAALLAAVGIYGLLAWTVARRRQEIGLRVALGARAGSVRSMVLRRGLRLAVAGVALGVVAAWGLASRLDALVFRVEPREPWLLAAVAAGVMGVAVLAAWVPALRATRLDPAETLRSG